MQIILSFSKTAHWHILHVTLHLCRYNCIVVDKRVHIIATRGWDVAGCAVSATTAALQRSLSVIVWASAAHQQAAAVGSRLLGSGDYLVYSQKHIVYNIMSAVAHFLFLRCQFIRIERSWFALTLLMLHRCRHWLSVGNSLIVHSAYTETSFCPYVCVNVRGPAFFCWGLWWSLLFRYSQVICRCTALRASSRWRRWSTHLVSTVSCVRRVPRSLLAVLCVTHHFTAPLTGMQSNPVEASYVCCHVHVLSLTGCITQCDRMSGTSGNVEEFWQLSGKCQKIEQNVIEVSVKKYCQGKLCLSKFTFRSTPVFNSNMFILLYC